MPVHGLPEQRQNPAFTIEEFVELVPKFKDFVEGDGSALYTVFYNIADQKILERVWNVDWKFAMSQCIAHYIDLINRETQKEFGLDEIAKDSYAKGVAVQIDKNKYDFEKTVLDHPYSKFWNSTEFGRILITLLQTKAVPTIIVVN
jgi:hypothetical protein